MKKKYLWAMTAGLIILTLILSACSITDLVMQRIATSNNPPSSTDVPTTEITPVIFDQSRVFSKAFSQYNQQQVTLPEKFTGGYTLPLRSDQVLGLVNEDLPLTDTQQAALLANGFVVLPPGSDPYRRYNEFYQAYESFRYSSIPVFVTTDSIFHVYHLVFDKMLRDLERTAFIPMLKELTSALLSESLSQYNSLIGTNMEEPALRNVAYFSVAARLLAMPDVNLPAQAQDLANRELVLIEEGSAREISPIWAMGGEAEDDLLYEDYSQYIPRGHYTRSEALKDYFKAMMWYGRMTFRLKYQAETQRALLMVQALRNAPTESGRSAIDLWQNIYDPTVFIVGKADDLSFHEYGVISDEVFGANPNLADFGDKTKMAEFKEAARQLPPPQVNSMWVYIWQDRDEATQGFRFMGQRFTLDQYVFGELIFRKVGTLDNPRALPKALDLLAAMGSTEAYTLLQDMGATDYENYDSQMEKVKNEVAGYGLDSWTQNLYWSWLYAMQPLFQPKGEQFPAFMQNQAWLHKDMVSALGTWTELKHDTLLYSKQVMAEMGGGGDEEPPKGYIEPNPEAFARLLALAEMTHLGLTERGLLDETTGGNLENLIDQLNFLLNVSIKQLTGEQITEDDYWRIQYYGGWLEAMTIAAADSEEETGGRNYLEDQKSALIADVASGYGSSLEEGVGYPLLMLVVSPEKPYHLTVGAVYSYYEFIVPSEQRMTDEEWRSMLEANSAPEMPEWVNSYIIP